MGSSQSKTGQEEGDGRASLLWCCFGGNEYSSRDQVRTSTDAPPHYGANHALQPQPRPQSARIRSERAGETTASGEWFASTMEAKISHTAKPSSIIRPQSIHIKKRKRSLSQVFAKRPNVRRPLTAPGRPQAAEWRVSIRSLGSTSPFPDFSTFNIENISTDDARSSCTYVNGASPRASRFTPVDWPLPKDPSNYPLLQTTLDSSSKGHSSQLERQGSSKTKLIKQQSVRRARALSEPFRYVRRARPSMSHHDRKGVNDEIQELQSLVEAKRAAIKAAPAQQERDSGLIRVRSRGHVPAIAPSMKVSVRSQVLSDIGSAFSKPLPSTKQAGVEKTPELESSDVTQVTPPREILNTSESGEPSSVVVPENSRLQALREHHSPLVESWTSRSSISSIAMTASDILASQLPTAPSTPSLSRTSSAQINVESRPSRNNTSSVSLAPMRKPPTLPGLVSGIFTAARNLISLDMLHSRSFSKTQTPSGTANFRMSGIEPPPHPPKATLKQCQ